MSDSFTKLFSSITSSTIWGEDSDTRVVWVTMLAMADQHGYVAASIPGLARQAVVSLEATERALAKFQAPDPYSRTRAHEGRRVEEVEGGWRLLNYQHYRELRDQEAHRLQERDRKRRQRHPEQYGLGQGGTGRDGPAKSQVVSQAEAEAEAEAEELTDTSHFERAWAVYPRRPNNSKAAALRAWKARRKANVPAEVMVEGAERYAAWCASQGVEPQFVKLGATFFGPDQHFLNDFSTPTGTGLSERERRSVAALNHLDGGDHA